MGGWGGGIRLPSNVVCLFCECNNKLLRIIGVIIAEMTFNL